MENQTRIKKYAKLRETIAQDVEQINYHDALAPFAKRLAKVDEKYHVDDELITSDYQPNHAKSKAYEPLFDENSDDLLNNELLSQFIDEVKDYNLQAGTRIADETSENIIRSLIQDQAIEETLLDLSPPLEGEAEADELEFNENEALIEDVIANIESQQTDHEQPLDEEAFWVQKTQELTQVIETMEHSLSDVSEKMLITNKTLNFLLLLFILGIVAVIGYFIYFVLQIQGIL